MKKVENKISQDELVKLQGISISDAEMHKYSLMDRLAGLQDNFQIIQKELMDKYGKVSISIVDGTIKEPEADVINP
jgi:hypothetical protein